MASNYQEGSDEGSNSQSSESCSDFSDSDTDSQASSESGSDSEEAPQTSSKPNVCMHYNRETNEEFDGPYRWQLKIGKGWENIANDHILEAQYSLPNTKGIKIYNTRAGAISIDFTKMRVLQKTNIKVRRMSSRDTEWLWYYRGDQSWCQYGEKGKASPIQSSQLEAAYQNNRRGSVKFTIDSTQYEISFKDMCQRNLSTGRKRRVRRRPKYVPSEGEGLRGIASQLKSILSPPTNSNNKTPEWQFKGRNGEKWYTFKNRGGCSVSSADIEKFYQQNQATMTFTVNNDTYTLDFATSGNHFEWQLFNGQQWGSILNDFVIEVHYCQAGAKGITIHLNKGPVYIDFDDMTVTGPLANGYSIRRNTLLSHNQKEVIGWYYKDNYRWCEYGSQGSGGMSSSITSDFIEQQYNINPRGSVQFTVGNMTYKVDFSAMTQTNLSTYMLRKVRRRPKFKEVVTDNSITQNSTLSQVRWQFMDMDGQWTDYIKGGTRGCCSVSSQDIEAEYQQDSTGMMRFRAGRFSYELDFSDMSQTNLSTNTRRSVRRL
ncbi:poly [ADP-ribose] polymerase 12-like isoform X1 [Labeo rohita]|uniref:Poly [ADP-ribose] polymerase 12-like isoform X1 n=1 Tax=Labeo rohita TaxID=84645 RepID=A0A498LAA0_LABRO|nr:poly [ADP-ribose] polymerase 12-like isoform X1 [Labeo rohita]